MHYADQRKELTSPFLCNAPEKHSEIFRNIIPTETFLSDLDLYQKSSPCLQTVSVLINYFANNETNS